MTEVEGAEHGSGEHRPDAGDLVRDQRRHADRERADRGEKQPDGRDGNDDVAAVHRAGDAEKRGEHQRPAGRMERDAVVEGLAFQDRDGIADEARRVAVVERARQRPLLSPRAPEPPALEEGGDGCRSEDDHRRTTVVARPFSAFAQLRRTRRRLGGGGQGRA